MNNTTTMFGKRKEEPEEIVDPTGWMLTSELAQIMLLHTNEIKYMAMFAYTFLHGAKLFPTFKPDSTLSFRFVSMIFQCTGGGILVPILVNAIPVPLATDSYIIAITLSFLIHQYAPIMREVLKQSAYLHTLVICLYECMRATVVVKLTTLAGNSIAPSEFSIAIFGPIMCGSIAGCGGAFLPLNKGLGPIETTGLAQPMKSAFMAATFIHLFNHTSLSDGIIDASKKAHLVVAIFFIAYNLWVTFGGPSAAAVPSSAVATETKKNK